MPRRKSTRSNSTTPTPLLDNISLHEAAWSGDVVFLNRLLNISILKPRIDDPDVEWGHRTPLHIASNQGHVCCCRALLECGADPSSRMYQGWTPAHCAAEVGYTDVLKVLAEYSADLFATDNYGDTPKRIAQLYGHDNCIDFLEKFQI